MERGCSDRLVLAFCRLGFAGLSPVMPGTCGTLLAIVLAPWLFLPLGLTARLCVLAAVFVVGSLAASRAERLLGRKDPGEVVIDELAGAWIALLPFAEGSLPLLAAAFFLFRVFDIAKPWPIHASENWLPDGWGVMLDDVLGGFMTLLVLLIARALDFLPSALISL